jgi:hypothetical protein
MLLNEFILNIQLLEYVFVSYIHIYVRKNLTVLIILFIVCKKLE